MTTWEVLALLGLLLLTALVAMARSALVNVRKPRLRELVDAGAGGARTAQGLAEDATRLLATSQLVTVLTSFFGGALVAVLSAPHLDRLLQPWLKGASYPVAFVLVVLVTALIMLIFGTMVPETVAEKHSERLSLWLARPLVVVSVLMMPLARFTVWLSNGLSRMLGATTSGGMPYVTEEQIRTLVDAGEEEGVIEEEEKEMIYSIFDLGDTLARQVMVPRIDVMALDVATPMLDVLEAIMRAGHSRVPMFDETIDNIVGVLYAKDLLPYLRDGKTDAPLRGILRPAYFIPETKRASDLLPDLQKRRVHMAIVVDEYGGMAGIVTIEDLLEEIVGEIQDEYDAEEPPIVEVSQDEYVMDGRLSLGDVNELMDAALPTEDSDTLGGFIYAELGRVPDVGARVPYEGLEFTVESVVGRRIRKVRVRRQAAPAPESGQEAPAAAREKPESPAGGDSRMAGSTEGRSAGNRD
ncbi:MAG TPA: hemolysin family protein [Anaerolineae bacterium]|nr:hemolysin family protein [Anaerolineae bacterium]